jgi:hypothetical protein
MDKLTDAKQTLIRASALKVEREKEFLRNTKEVFDMDIASYNKQIAEAQAVIDKADEPKPVKATARRKRK